MNKYFVLVLSGICITAAIHAQGFLCGRIVDSEDGTPVYGATIYVSELRTGASTDTSGNFRINNVPAGTFLAEIRMIGYATLAYNLTTVGLNGEYYTVPTIRLIKTPAEYHPVIITGVSGTQDRKRNPAPSILMSREHLLEHSATNAVNSLAELPGISTISTGNAISKPVIRGLGYNRVIVLRNGVRQEGQQWGDEHGVEIDEFEIDRVEIIKGPGSIMYGSDAMAGVINFLTIHPVAQGTVGGEILTGFHSNGMLFGNSIMTEGNLNGITWQVRGSQKISGNYKTPVDGYVANSGFSEYNASGFIGLNRSWGVTQLSFSTFNQQIGLPEGERDSLGNFVLPIITDSGTVEEAAFLSDELKGYRHSIETPSQKINHNRFGWSTTVYNKKGRMKFDLGLQQNTRKEFGEAAEPEAVEVGFKLTTITVNSVYYSNEPDPGKDGGQLAAGISLQQQQNENFGGEFIIPEYTSRDAGLFAHYHYLIDEIYVGAGVRGDVRNIRGSELFLDTNGIPAGSDTSNTLKFGAFDKTFGSVSAIAGISWQPKESTVFRFNISRGFRAPNIAELASNGRHEGTFRYESGNNNLQPETSLQIDLGIVFTSDHFNFEVSGFTNNIQNYIYLSKINSVFGGDSIVDPADPAPLFSYAQGSAQLIGCEVTTDIHPHPLDWLHFENSFAFVNGTLLNQPDSMTNLPFMPPMKIQSELHAHSENGKGVFQHYFAGITGAFYFTQSRIYSAYETETSTPSYFLLEASAGSEIVNKKGTTVCTISFHANNLLDTKYQSHLSRLKYAPVNPATGNTGIFGQGRNFSVRLLIPFSAVVNKS
jgi:iron complex outermembrane receptor protein